MHRSGEEIGKEARPDDPCEEEKTATLMANTAARATHWSDPTEASPTRPAARSRTALFAKDAVRVAHHMLLDSLPCSAISVPSAAESMRTSLESLSLRIWKRILGSEFHSAHAAETTCSLAATHAL